MSAGKYAPPGRDGARHLVQYMAQQGLRFAPAVDGMSGLHAMHHALVA